MNVLHSGHSYVLDQLDGDDHTNLQVLQFVQRAPHHPPRAGTTNQEVCRVLIHRIRVLDAEKPWVGNRDILEHLRHVIILHEVRAYQRHKEKRYAQKITPSAALLYVSAFLFERYPGVEPEDIPVGADGHWVIP